MSPNLIAIVEFNGHYSWRVENNSTFYRDTVVELHPYSTSLKLIVSRVKALQEEHYLFHRSFERRDEQQLRCSPW